MSVQTTKDTLLAGVSTNAQLVTKNLNEPCVHDLKKQLRLLNALAEHVNNQSSTHLAQDETNTFKTGLVALDNLVTILEETHRDQDQKLDNILKILIFETLWMGLAKWVS